MYGNRSPCEPQQLITIRLAIRGSTDVRGGTARARLGACAAGSLRADDEVHDPAAHVDRALHGLAREVAADVLILARDVDDLVLAGLRRRAATPGRESGTSPRRRACSTASPARAAPRTSRTGETRPRRSA